MSIHAPLLEAARSEIDVLCRKVGLQAEALAASANAAVQPPSGAALWANGYACVLLWPVHEAGAQALQTAADQGQGWFDAVLATREANASGRVVDGYLVLALPAEPTEDLQEDVRKIELSSQICRKHLIWPTAPGEPKQS